MLRVSLKSSTGKHQRQLTILVHGTCAENGRGGKCEDMKLPSCRNQAGCKGKVYFDKLL